MIKTNNLKSNEEKYFAWWLEEAKVKGYIKEWSYEPKSFALSPKQTNKFTKQLKTKIKECEETILQPHIYTPDFEIVWRNKAIGKFLGGGKQKSQPFKLAKGFPNLISYVETKGSFDQNNMTRLFSINKKWVFQKYGIYVNLCKISTKKGSFFDKTFTPIRFVLTEKTKKIRKLGYKATFLNTIKCYHRNR